MDLIWNLIADYIAWFKALHMISIIAWMAGLFYLPRLFIYHVQNKSDRLSCETFKTMERRLLKVIMNPAMLASWIFGLVIAFQTNAFSQPWFHVKLFLVLVMTVFHMMLGKWRKGFEIDQNKNSERFYRFANEVPTVLMVIIVLLVMVKPF